MAQHSPAAADAAAATPFHFVHQGDCCYTGGGRRLRVIANTPNRTACEAFCLAEPDCAYVSRHHTKGGCALCATCTLRQHSGHFTSWSRWPMPSPVEQLGALLQDDYSIAVYGAPNRVDVQSLRVIWLALLPPEALRVIVRLGGLCKYESGYPWRPFLAALDLYSNPLDAAWVSWERNTLHGFPVANHSWVEVTHCKSAQSHIGAAKYGWQFGPMWLYAAPGSGVSINVGRSLVVNYADAARLLRRVYPSALECACSAGCEFGLRPGSTKQVNGSSCLDQLHDPQWLTTDGGTASPSPSHRKLQKHTHCWSRDAVLAELDTIQIYDHTEFFGRERRHEIVRLRHDGECASLRPSTPQLMCGKVPHLAPCGPNSSALRRLGSCATGKHVLSSAIARAVNLTGRCAMTSSF